MSCSVEGCDREVRARKMCSRHYQRWQKHGDTVTVLPPGPRRDMARHGSRRKFDLGCRCFECRIGNNAYHNNWRANGPTRVDVEEVVAHIDSLLASGWTKAQITRAADVGNSTIYTLCNREVRGVNRDTAERIFDLEPLRGEQKLPVEPIERFLRNKGGVKTLLASDSARRQFYRCLNRGWIGSDFADELAVRVLGLTLEELYGSDWDEIEIGA